MRTTIATLVRVGEHYTYVSRSFTEINDEAIATIRGCIEEDNEETFTKEEIEKYYDKSFETLKEDYTGLGEPDYDFDHQGHCIWEYNDGIEIISYVIHVSIIEI